MKYLICIHTTKMINFKGFVHVHLVNQFQITYFSYLSYIKAALYIKGAFINSILVQFHT